VLLQRNHLSGFLVALVLGFAAGCRSGLRQTTAGSSNIAAPVHADVALGAGLEPIVDWARTEVFVDLVKQSRGFGPATTANPVTPVPLDAKGWPIGDFGIILWTNAAAVHGLGGTYKLSCNGLATIGLIGSNASIANLVYTATTNTTTADVVVLEGSDNLILSFIGALTGVQNLKILRPGYGPSDTFTTPLKNQLSRFNVIRFMDWASTNNNPIARWSDRSLPTDPRYSRDVGVPWEIAIQLANELRKDMWVNIPISADDDYVKQFATLLKSQLDPALHVYVEYSNEVWNFQFKQAQTNLDLAKAEVALGGSPLNADGNTNQYYWGWRRVALRLKQISDIFASVYGRVAMNTTVRMVLAGQSANPAIAREGLQLIERTYGPPGQFFYAVAGAPYFAIGAADSSTTLTPDQVIAALSTAIDNGSVTYHYEENAALARWYGMPYVAYEGGPDTFGPNNVAAKSAAQFDPRMKDLVVRYLNAWYAYGFGLFNWFVAGATPYNTAYGTWGLTDDMSNLNTPKLQGIDAVASGPRPAITGGWGIPGEADARGSAGAPRPFTSPYLTGLGNGDYRDYLVRAPADGKYRIEVAVASAWPGAKLAILANHAQVAIQDVPATGGDSTFQYLAPVTATLTAGMNVVRLQVANAGFNISSLRLSPL
jgi:hypothetical protein